MEYVEVTGGYLARVYRAGSDDTGPAASRWPAAIGCGKCYLGMQHTENVCKLERSATLGPDGTPVTDWITCETCGMESPEESAGWYMATPVCGSCFEMENQ